jgi:hypothetical protein
MSAHVSERLSAYLDGELDPVGRAAVDEHLGACEACAWELAALAAIDGLARELPPDAAPSGYFEAFPGRVRRRLEGRSRGVAWRPPTWTWAAAAAALLAVITPLVLKRAQVPSAEAPLSEQATPPAAAPARPPEALARPEPAPAPAPPAPAPAAPAPAAPRVAPRPAPEGFARAPAAPPPMRNEVSSPEAAAVPTEGGASGLTASAAGRAARPVGRAPEPKAADEAAPVEEQRMQEAQPAAKARPLADEQTGYRALVARPARTLAEARGLREAWRAFSLRHPEGPHADEARVRVVEAGAAAWKLSGDPEDLARARADAAAYLARSDAAQPARVRAALEDLER